MVSFGLPHHFYLLLYYYLALFFCYLHFVVKKIINLLKLTNINGLASKLADIQFLLKEVEFDILARVARSMVSANHR